MDPRKINPALMKDLLTFNKALKIFFLFFFSLAGFFSNSGIEFALFGRKGIVHFPP
jgi:hypothetical protein